MSSPEPSPEPTQQGKVRVLVVDDEPMNLELLERSLRRKYEVISAESGEQALVLLRNTPDIAVILSDYRMPSMSGAEMLADAMTTHPQVKRVVITGYADADSVISAINKGHIHYLIKKPWKHQQLHQVLEQLVHTYQLEEQNRRLLAELQSATEHQRGNMGELDTSSERSAEPLEAGSSRPDDSSAAELDVGTLGYRDELTGLYSRRTFQERLREEVARARRYGHTLALLYGDVDNLTTVNKQVSYQVGNEVLRRIAALMSDPESEVRCRASDVVARFDGQIFTLLLPETPKDGALVKAQRLRAAVAETRFPEVDRVTISLGIASFPEDANNADELVSCAKQASAVAKQAGRDYVHAYGATMTPQRAPAETLGGGSVRDSPTFYDISRFKTYYEELSRIATILRRDRVASALFIDVSHLRRIELEHGAIQASELYIKAGFILSAMRGDELFDGDLICRTEEGEGYLCILSPEHNKAPDLSLEDLADRVQQRLVRAVMPEVYDVSHRQPRLSVGFARVLHNSMLRPERQIARLMSEARASAALQRERAASLDKAFLQQIILNNGLSPVYQPIVHLESGEVFGYEALTRGPRQTSLESPGSLFSVAEEVSLTFELDRACFRTALRGALGLEPIHRLFVNLLPLSFYDASFIETEVSNLLDAAALTPANVVFEITEQLAIENFTSFREILARYTAMGFGVAIDDVGTRHSNLESVMSLRPHLIKISDVLTRGVARSPVKREMLQSLNRIAEAIDAVVVAEGIETPDDLVVLHDLNVRYGQGYFLARPGPPFPQLRASVRRAVHALASTPRKPLASPPADFDDEGDFRESTRPGREINEVIRAMAHGSSQFDLPADDDGAPAHEADDAETGPQPLAPGTMSRDDDFGEETKPHVPSTHGSWKPFSVEDLGVSDTERGVPLIDSLLRRKPSRD